MVQITDPNSPELVVKPDVAIKQIEAELVALTKNPDSDGTSEKEDGLGEKHQLGENLTDEPLPPATTRPKRFHGTATLDTTRVGRDASRIAEEVIAHLVSLVGARVTVTIEIEAELPEGAPDNVVRTVTENSRTLKFTSQGFEKE